MAEITAALVKELRERSGVGMMDCKKALQETGGDIEAAIDWLRAKGLSEKVVINKHAFRNTLIPLVSYMSYLLPSMFGGALITETLFQIPGIGYVSYQAIVRGDIPFAMFYTTFLIVLTQVSLILADIMYAVVDPRVRAN